MGKNTVETDIFDAQYQTWTPGPTFPKGAKDQGSLGVYQDKLYYSDGQNIYALENDQWSHKNELSSKMINLCLPKAPSTAIFLFILITFFLTASDAGSDIALGYFLYYRQVLYVEF